MEIEAKIKELERGLEALKESVKETENNRPITERVKTFGDAVEILGKTHPFVAQWEWNSGHTGKEYADLDAFLKLRIITAALNEGWEPQFTKNEHRYYPWFCLYTRDELDELDNVSKTGGFLLGITAINDETAGYVFATALSTPSAEYAYIGSRLCFKTDELARYAGRQFADLYADLYLIRK